MDISESSDSSDSSDSLLEEFQELVEHCQGLHLHHHAAINSLHTIQQLLHVEETITIHYQCEDHDFGTLLESLHTQTMEEIDQGASPSFGQKLFDVLAYSSFSS